MPFSTRVNRHLLWLLLSLPLALASSDGAEPRKWSDRQETPRQVDDAGQLLRCREPAPRFLSPQTSPFAVNSSHLYNVDFDLGESYAGLLPVGNSSDAELFFWFFPSSNASVGKEIVIWLGGGPGCSGVQELFLGNGPVIWPQGTQAPIANPWSWHQLSNVVWIDQPVGTGYSQGQATARNEADVSAQFNGFWKNFVDLFDLLDYKIYFTGVSYAGMFCPYLASGMLDQNDTAYFDVNGLMVMDGLINDFLVPAEIVSVPFVDYWSGHFPFNDSFREDIHQRHIACGYDDYLAKYLVFPAAGLQPTQIPGVNANRTAYLPGCDIYSDVMAAATALNPCFDFHKIDLACPAPLNPVAAPILYFNRTDVKAALHVPANTNWAACVAQTKVFPQGDSSPPSIVSALPRVIDATQNVVLGHGALDMNIILNGTVLGLQNMTWGGELGFLERPAAPFYVPYHPNPNKAAAAGAGVLGTTHTERGLTFSVVNLAGHFMAEHQRGAAYRQLELVLGRIGSLEDKTPFTTDVNATAQSTGPLGMGTGPQIYYNMAANSSVGGSS